MITSRNVRLPVLIAVVVATTVIAAYVHRAANQRAERQELVNSPKRARFTQDETPNRPESVPLSARWVGSADGGAWLDCRFEPKRNMNYCAAYNYQNGQILTEGYYTASDTGVAAQNDELFFEGFDGARIYLAKGRVLEPIKDPLESITSARVSCEGNAYYTSDAEDNRPNQEYCYKLQKWLIEASLHGNLEQIRKALAAGAHIEGTYYSSLPALQCAAMMGQANAVVALLDSGADVNRVAPLGNTALKVAVFEGHANIVRLLLDRGAQVRDYDGGRTAEEIAQKQSHQEILQMLKAARTSN